MFTGYTLSTAAVFEVGGRTDADGNPHQEDALSPAPDALCCDDRLFVLCDGMGGHEAGEVASDTVCRAIAASVAQSCPDDSTVFTGDMLDKAISDAYDALDGADTDANAVKKMGTTMTMLKFHGGGVTAAHIGDSRIYHMRTCPGKPASVIHVTVDHSLVNELVKIGELTPEEAAVHPRRNVLSRAMQPHVDYRPGPAVYETEDVLPGDIFYMCSDGMLEQMDDAELCSFFVGGEDGRVDVSAVAASLCEATKDNRDNHSAFIIAVGAVEGAASSVTDKSSAAVASGRRDGRRHVSKMRQTVRRTTAQCDSRQRGVSSFVVYMILLGACLAVFLIWLLSWL